MQVALFVGNRHCLKNPKYFKSYRNHYICICCENVKSTLRKL